MTDKTKTCHVIQTGNPKQHINSKWRCWWTADDWLFGGHNSTNMHISNENTLPLDLKRIYGDVFFRMRNGSDPWCSDDINPWGWSKCWDKELNFAVVYTRVVTILLSSLGYLSWKVDRWRSTCWQMKYFDALYSYDIGTWLYKLNIHKLTIINIVNNASKQSKPNSNILQRLIHTNQIIGTWIYFHNANEPLGRIVHSLLFKTVTLSFTQILRLPSPISLNPILNINYSREVLFT